MCTTFETVQLAAAKKNASKLHKINIDRTGLPVSNAIYYATLHLYLKPPHIPLDITILFSFHEPPF